jgi:hypothetical protein
MTETLIPVFRSIADTVGEFTDVLPGQGQLREA